MTSAAIFKPTWYVGGAERYLVSIARAMSDAGLTVSLAGLETPPMETFEAIGGDPSSFITWDSAAAASFDLVVDSSPQYRLTTSSKRRWVLLYTPPGVESPKERVRQLVAERLHPDVPRVATDRMRKDVRLGAPVRYVTCSQYSAGRIRDRLGVDATVVYPCASASAAGKVDQRVVAVSRIAPFGEVKKHLQLLDAFSALRSASNAPWELHLAGTSSPTTAADRAYVEDVNRRAAAVGATVHPNASPAQLGELLGSSTYFWHAAGYGVDDARRPDDVEHFGIAIAEAMQAGAIPCVVPAGAMPELVLPDTNGVHWRSPSELTSAVLALDAAARQRAAMRAAAESTGRMFTYERLSAQIERLVTQDLA